MIDPDELINDLPNEDDEAILEILKRFVALNKKGLMYTSKSADNIELLHTALDEFEAFDRVPELTRALQGESDAIVENRLTDLISIYGSRLAQSRQRAALSQAKDKLREGIRIKRDTAFGYARLGADERLAIHAYLSHIRELIQESTSIVGRKKNALLDRLNDLARDVDKAGTKMDGFVAFWVDLGFGFGAAAQAAKPALNELKEVLKILYNSRAREEQVSLPPPDEQLRLPSPGSIEE